MQRFDQIDETLAPHSQDSAKLRALQLQSTVLDASTSSTSSASVHESIATDPQSLTLFSTTLNETLQTPSFHPELVMSTEDLEALSPMSSLRESNLTIWDGCDVDCLARWVDISNDSSSIVSKYPLLDIYPADFCSVRTLPRLVQQVRPVRHRSMLCRRLYSEADMMSQKSLLRMVQMSMPSTELETIYCILLSSQETRPQYYSH
jgi:hypothetical protein